VTSYSPAHDVADLLDTSATGLSLGTDLFIGRLPHSPDDAVACIDQSGAIVGRDIDSGDYMRRPSVQVLIRSNTLQSAWTLVQSVRDALDGQTAFSGRSWSYGGVSEEGDVIRLGVDENDRERFAINYQLTKEI
jgi:hypothetical protein